MPAAAKCALHDQSASCFRSDGTLLMHSGKLDGVVEGIAFCSTAPYMACITSNKQLIVWSTHDWTMASTRCEAASRYVPRARPRADHQFAAPWIGGPKRLCLAR